MPRLLGALTNIRRSPHLLKLPPYLSLLCILIGIAWLLLLPLDNYSRRTYISENALLPGQVHTYFSGSDQHVARAYKHEVKNVAEGNNTQVNDKLESIFRGMGLKVGRQEWRYSPSGEVVEGENVYAVLQAPRGDATEALVLMGAWKNAKGETNINGVALILTLARYFRRWSLWSKDIIFLVTPDWYAGPQAWADAYHDSHDPRHVASLPLKSGALQAAVVLDFAQEHFFKNIHISYDGVNGQLPNLDLINSVVNIAGGQLGIGSAIQDMLGDENGQHRDHYEDRLRTMLRGMAKQGLGMATGPHSSFIPYHVDAITLTPYGSGPEDEMAMGRVVEGTFRSLNNLLEHLHQSFFFYLLMHKDRFVSIGTYLPSAMLVAVNFTIVSIFLWVRSGQSWTTAAGLVAAGQGTTQKDVADADKDKEAVKAVDGPSGGPTVERQLFLPLALVTACQFLGVVPYYFFNHLPSSLLFPTYTVFSLASLALPHLISYVLNTDSHLKGLTAQQYDLTQCFSLLVLGMFLASLATLNFSLSFWIGLLASPLSFVRPWPNNTSMRYASSIGLALLSPPAVITTLALVSGTGHETLLKEAAFGHEVWGMYTSVVVWCVWWPAWLAGSVLVLGKPQRTGKLKTT